METTVLLINQHHLEQSSYRTYEEWKPDTQKIVTLNITSSYRTYEEWKPLTMKDDNVLNKGSYRTYEEWKLPIRIRTAIISKVLTVPMRNGNEVNNEKMKRKMGRFLPYL